MTVIELLRGIVGGSITEAQFAEDFFRLFGVPGNSDAETECLNELIDDINMAEHVGPLFTKDFLWEVEGCLRLLSEGASPTEIRKFFATNPAP